MLDVSEEKWSEARGQTLVKERVGAEKKWSEVRGQWLAKEKQRGRAHIPDLTIYVD
jgi:hypothetical protein